MGKGHHSLCCGFQGSHDKVWQNSLKAQIENSVPPDLQTLVGITLGPDTASRISSSVAVPLHLLGLYKIRLNASIGK